MNREMNYKCEKCGKGHFGLHSTTICSRCLIPKDRVTKLTCKICESKCRKNMGDDLCGKCRAKAKYKKENNPNGRNCEMCGSLLRTENPKVTICSRSSCLGKRDYIRVIRDVKTIRTSVA